MYLFKQFFFHYYIQHISTTYIAYTYNYYRHYLLNLLCFSKHKLVPIEKRKS